MDAVLDRFEGRFAEHMPFIDELLRKEQPGHGDVSQFLTRVPQNDVTEEYFFGRASARWLVPLRKKGVFTSPPKARRNERQSGLVPRLGRLQVSCPTVGASRRCHPAGCRGGCPRHLVHWKPVGEDRHRSALSPHPAERRRQDRADDLAVAILGMSVGRARTRGSGRTPTLAGGVSRRAQQLSCERCSPRRRALLLLGDREVDVDSCYDEFEFEQVVQEGACLTLSPSGGYMPLESSAMP